MLRTLEIIWLIVAIVSMVLGIYISITKGFGEGYIFYIFTVVGGLMYYVRHKQRISWERKKAEKNA
jgi:hypothetical protein